MKKQTSFLKLSLKYLALISLFLTSFPFVSLISGIKPLSYGKVFILSLFSVICGFFGFAFKNLLEKAPSLKPYQITVFLIILAAAPLFFALFISKRIEVGIIENFLLPVLFCAVYLVGILSYKKEYYEILTSRWLVTASLINLFSIIAAGLFRIDISESVFVSVFIFSVCVCAFASNQKAIDYMMERRGHSMAQLPPKIRYYNLCLVFAVLVFAICFFVFKGEFVSLGGKVLQALKNAFPAVLRFLAALTAFIKGDNTGSASPQAPDANDDGNFLDTAEAGNPIISAVILIIIVITILVLLIKPICGAIKKLIKSASSLIRDWMKLSRKKSNIRLEQTLYYTDSEEHIDKSLRKKSSSGKNKELRLWKSDLKSFSKMPDGKDKMLFGYRLAVRGLLLCGYDILPCDTQLDIIEKAKKKLSGKAFEAATYCYNELVFGNFKPDNLKIPEIEETLKAIKTLSVSANKK